MRAVLLLVPLLLAGAAEEPAFAVAGTVRADTPVEGARVRVYDGLAPSVLLGEARTGKDGSFRVPVGRDVAQAREHPWAPVRIRAEADGYARRATGFELGGGSVELRLVPPRVRRGTLVDGDGRPVPGAFLLATQLASGVEVLVTSDENGAFEIDTLGPEPVSVRIRAPGFEPVDLLDLDAAREPIVLQPFRADEAQAAVVLAGRVLDEEGRPVPGARVTAGERGAWTDARGEWRLELPQAVRTTLEATAPAKAPRRVTLRTDRAGRVDLRVVAGAAIEGRVVDGEGAPVLGARVAAVAGARPPRRRLAVAWSGPDGTFRLRGVPPGAERLVARGHGLGSAPLSLPAAGRGTLVLRAELPVGVHVRDDTGLGLAGVEVLLAQYPPVPPVRGRTDEEGWFRAAMPADAITEASVRGGTVVGHVEPGGTIELVVPRDHGDASIRFAIEGDLPVEARLVHAEFARRLAGASGVFGELATGRYRLTVTAEGFLPETRTLVVERPDQELALSIALRRAGEVALHASPGARVAVQTLAGEPSPVVVLVLDDGSQVVQGFGPGRYRFLARAPGELIRVVEAELRPDAAPVDLDLQGGAASTLAVAVVDRAGAPVEGAALALRTPGGFAWDTGRRTDADGRARLERLIAGPLEVRATLGDRLGGVRVEVRPGAELRAVVTLP